MLPPLPLVPRPSHIPKTIERWCVQWIGWSNNITSLTYLPLSAQLANILHVLVTNPCVKFSLWLSASQFGLTCLTIIFGQIYIFYQFFLGNWDFFSNINSSKIPFVGTIDHYIYIYMIKKKTPWTCLWKISFFIFYST